MKIEAGNDYRTRDGRKARVLCTDCKIIGPDGGYYSVLALLATDVGTGTEVVLHLYEDGTRYQDGTKRGVDLVSHWYSEPVVDWDKLPAWALAVSYDGSTWQCHVSEPITGNHGDSPYSSYLMSPGMLKIPPCYWPEYEGTIPPMESLIRKPGAVER